MIVTVPSASKRMPPISLLRRRGDFEIAADAAMPRSLPRLRLSRLRAAKPFQSASFERLVEQRGEVAAVVGQVGGGRERQFPRLDVVAPAQLEPVDAHLAGGGVDQPLHEIVALGPAGAAIGVHIGVVLVNTHWVATSISGVR